LLAKQEQRQALNCIRCGACLNGCPVYKNIGGHAYGTTYSGPIGSVITPHLRELGEYKHLSHASSLCGKCTEVCPVKIDLHKHLLFNRHDAVEKGYSTFLEKTLFKAWKAAMLNRSLMNMGSPSVKNFIIGLLFRNTWGKNREIPKLAPKSFNQLWKERLSSFDHFS
jgi:L-lactate dehydrogenase complex protein LldF